MLKQKHLQILLPIVALTAGALAWITSQDSPSKSTESAKISPKTPTPSSPDLATVLWKNSKNAPKTQTRIKQELEKRRSAFITLMKEKPRQAIAQAPTLKEYQNLPNELKPFYARPFSANGNIDLLWETSLATDGSKICSHKNSLQIGSETLHAYSTKTLEPLLNTPTTGIRLGNHAVISDSQLLPLAQDQIQAAKELYPTAQNTNDPLTSTPSFPDHAAIIAGTIYNFSSPQSIEVVNNTLQNSATAARKDRLSSAQQPFPWIAGSTGGDTTSGITAPTPYQEEQIKVLFIRVDFSDFQGAPVSKTDLETTLTTVNGHLDTYSYNKAGITTTVTDSVYRMPQTGATYALAGNNDGIQDDARTLASANYTIADYDVIAVYFPNIGSSQVSGSIITYAGLASIGGSSHWINGTNSVGVILHEFGHNYGLYHANYHHPEQSLGGTYQTPTSLEYGDIFDEMGRGDSPQAHFSHLGKKYMQWMPDSKVAEATSTDTYTIYRFDHASALSNPLLAVKVPMSGNVNYWLGYRKLFTSSAYNLDTGAYVVAENLANARETSLIDMTPESQASESDDRKDAGLPLNGTLYDSQAGVRFENLEAGGTAPNEWIKVKVTFDPRISVKESQIAIDEQSGSANITVQRRFSSDGAVSVDFNTNDGTATANTDYYSTSGTLTWADGDDTDKTITIPIRPDLISEGEETITLSLTNIAGGKLDPSANTTTISILDAGQRVNTFDPPFFFSRVDSIVPLNNGQIYIGGDISAGIGDFDSIRHIARLNADGSVDPTFASGTGFNAPVRHIELLPDGDLIVAGEFTSYQGETANRVIRLNSDGSIDSSFLSNLGSAANSRVTTVAVESAGSILLGGSFSSFNNISCEGIIRLSASGSPTALNTPFVVSWSTAINDIVTEANGTFTVVGSLYISAPGPGFKSGIARLNSDGTRDTTFQPNAGTHASGSTNSLRSPKTILRQPDGKYIISGKFSAYDENDVSNHARVMPDGSFDSSYTLPNVTHDTDTNFINVNESRRQASGKVIIGGYYNSPSYNLARLNTDGSPDTSFDIGSGADGPVYAIAFGQNESIWIGGNFYQYNGSSSRPIVQITGASTPYEIWQQSRFTPAQIALGLADSDQDPDGDGITNLAEMAMATNPNIANIDPVFSINTDSGISIQELAGEKYLRISLDKAALAEGAWFVAQFSSDMVTWSPTNPTPATNATYEVIENTSTRITVRDKTPMTSENMRFGRILIKQPE